MVLNENLHRTVVNSYIKICHIKYQVVFISLIFPLFLSTCNAKSYVNYTLFQAMPVRKHHLEFFRNLSHFYHVNFWTEPGSLHVPVDFVIAPEDKMSFLEIAKKLKVKLTTVMENIQSVFDDQTVKPYIRRKMETFDWRNYYTLNDIYSWLKDMRAMFPNVMHIQSMGKTKEGRDILVARIVMIGSSRRSKVIIEGGIHAREWISPAFVTYMIQRVLNSATDNSAFRKIALTYEWFFIPILNPDGYEYTHSKNRLWRKNRNNGGIDLNRNFGYAFGTEGCKWIKSSETYCGAHAFSEKESQALKNYVAAMNTSLEYYLSFHSYGQYIIIPYGNTKKHVENYDETHKMGLKAANVIKTFSGKKYTVGTAQETVGYMVSGSSTCWAKSTLNIPYVFTFELRDKGQYGFALPTSQIIPTCEETMVGVISLLTPKTEEFIKLEQDIQIFHENEYHENGHRMCFLDRAVFFFNLIIIITVLL